MMRSDRGVYQPSSDRLELYDPVEDDEDQRSRLPLLIVIALVVLAAFVGVVWLTYNQGVQSGRAGAPIVVSAPPGPVKTAPQGAEAGTTPYANLKVYDQPLPPDEEAEASTLAPPPPATQELAVTVANNQQPSPITQTPQLSATSPVVRAAQEAAVQQPAQLTPPPAPTPTAPKSLATVVSPPPPAASAPTPPPAVATVSATGGKAVLQIGAYESEALADAAWKAFRARHAAATAGLGPDIQRADLGDKGVWFRLRVGPFADKASAGATCEKLKAEGAGCFAAAP